MNKVQQESFKILREIDRICRKHDIPYFLSSGTLLGAVRHKGFIPWDDDLDIGMTRDSLTKFEKVIAEELDPGYFYQSKKTDRYYFNSYPKIRSNSYKLIERTTKHLSIHKGVWVDIFPYDNVSNIEKERTEQFLAIRKIDDIMRRFLYIYPTEKDRGLKKFIKSTIRFINGKLVSLYFFLPRLYKKRDLYLNMFNHQETDYVNMISYPLSKDEYIGNMTLKEDVTNLIEVEFESMSTFAPENYDRVLSNKYGDYMKLPKKEERVPSHGIFEEAQYE